MMRLRAGFADKANDDYSIFVSFNYNPEYVNLIKSLPNRIWLNNIKEWEVPYSDYSILISTLNNNNVYYDGQAFMKSIDDLSKEVEKMKAIRTVEANVDASILDDVEFKTQPYNYQKEGIAYGLNIDNFLLADDQGCVDENTIVQINISGASRKVTIKEAYRLFHNHKKYKYFRVTCLKDDHFGTHDVKDIIFTGNKPCYKLTLEDDKEIIATQDHPILTNKGYVALTELNYAEHKIVTNEIENIDIPELQNIKNIEFVGNRNVYDIKMEDPHHNFVGNGIVVHNCGKSLMACNIARLKRGGQHCLIIVGYDALQFNWVNEIKKHCDEGAYVLGQKLNRNKRYVAGSVKDRFEDLQRLDQIEEFFIITTVTTLRQCIKNKYIDKKGKTKTNKDFYIAQLIEHWCRKGVIGRIIFDEIQTCVHGNTQVTCGNQRIAVNKLYKQFQKNPNMYINSYNMQTGLVESKKILEMTKSENEVSFIRLHLEHEGVFTELTVTPEHKILTNNRGWIEAQDLEDTDDIVVDPKWFNVNKNKYVKKQCEYCGNIFVTTDKDKRFCNGTCASYWRFAKLINKTEVKKMDYCYDLTVQDNHNFIANGVVIHNCKNYEVDQTQALLQIKNCAYKIAATGTPIMNKNIDLFAIMTWLGYENRNYWEFRDRYCKMGGYKNKQIVGDKNNAELHARLSQFMIRRKKEDVLDLPEKIIIDELLDMDGKQWSLYDKTQRLAKAQLAQMKGNKVALLAALLNLRKITTNPSWYDESIKDSVKFERARQIVYEAAENDRKCIIFSNWATPITSLAEELSIYNPAMIIGDTKDRMCQVEKFQNDPSCKVILGTIGAMGTGLTLTAASNVIFIDEPWNRALKDQATDRAYRIGTKYSVNVYTLICKDTIDCMVHNTVYKKGRIADEIIDGVTTEELESMLENL